MQYSIPDNPRGRHTEDNKKIDETVFEEKKPSSSDLTAESEPPLDQNEAGNQSSHPLDPLNKEDPAPPEKKDDFEDSKSLSKASEDGDLEMPNSDLDPNLKIGEEPSSEMTASSAESPSIPDSIPPDNSEGGQDLKGQQLFQQKSSYSACLHGAKRGTKAREGKGDRVPRLDYKGPRFYRGCSKNKSRI